MSPLRLSVSLSHRDNDLGSNSSNFTVTPDLFLANPAIDYWRFEVLCSLPSTTGSSALNFVINQAPQNGSCSVSPLAGTTSTWFTIACSQWQDPDGIKDYSFYSMLLNFSIGERGPLLSHPDLQVGRVTLPIEPSSPFRGFRRFSFVCPPVTSTLRCSTCRSPFAISWTV